MVRIRNGVIQKSTGYLTRFGYSDFTIDGSFDSLNEEQIPDCPHEIFLLNDPFFPNSPKITKWDGQNWHLIDRPIEE